MAATLAAGLGGAASAGDPALGAGDRLDISVFSRPELSRAYRVRLDGTISLHIVGRVQAAGLTPSELETQLEDRLREVFEGITSTTIEVIEYRPVTVGGHVADPGAYPFAAGLDVGRAVALAGGIYRAAEQGGVAAQMQVESEAAKYEVFRVQLAGALIERARLIAERDDAPGVEAPEEASRILDLGAQELAAAQTALREAREEQLSLRIETSRKTRNLAVSEVAAYVERQELIGRQLDATLDELAKQEDLATRGLGRAARMFDLRLSAEGHRVNELEAVALEALSRQRVSEAEAGIERASVSHAASVARDLAAVDADIAELRAEMAQARRFVQVFGGAPVADDGDGTGFAYLIRRPGPEGEIVVEADAKTMLAPGDMLEVSLIDAASSGRGDEVSGR